MIFFRSLFALLLFVCSFSNPVNLRDYAASVLHENWNFGLNATLPHADALCRTVDISVLFAAVGFSVLNEKELSDASISASLKGQWINGMVPSNRYFQGGFGCWPSPDIWGVPSGLVPRNRVTSGVMALPFHASAALHSFARTEDESVVQNSFNEILDFHRYIFRERLISVGSGEKLVFSRHPLELLLPYSPCYDDLIERTLAVLPECDASLRSKNVTSPFDRATICLAECASKWGYNETAIAPNCPFLVADVGVSAVFLRSATDLLAIANILVKDSALKSELKGHIVQLTSGIKGQFNSSSLIYDSLFVHPGTGRQEVFQCRSASSISPLMASPSYLPGGSYELAVDARLSDALSSMHSRIVSLSSQLFSPSFFAFGKGGDSDCVGAEVTRIVPTLGRQEPRFNSSLVDNGAISLPLNALFSAGLEAPGIGYVLSNDSVLLAQRHNISVNGTFELTEWLDATTGCSIGPNASTAAAGAVLMLLSPVQSAEVPSRSPVSFTLTIIILVLELVFVLAIAVGCVVATILYIRRIRKVQRPTADIPDGTDSDIGSFDEFELERQALIGRETPLTAASSRRLLQPATAEGEEEEQAAEDGLLWRTAKGAWGMVRRFV